MKAADVWGYVGMGMLHTGGMKHFPFGVHQGCHPRLSTNQQMIELMRDEAMNVQHR